MMRVLVGEEDATIVTTMILRRKHAIIPGRGNTLWVGVTAEDRTFQAAVV